MSVAKHRAKVAIEHGKKVPVRDYFIVHLGIATGLRVMKIAALKCCDLHLYKDLSLLDVAQNRAKLIHRPPKCGAGGLFGFK